MDGLEKRMLLLRARIMVATAEKRLKKKPQFLENTLTLKAHYLGQQCVGVDYNPFAEIEHRFQKEMVAAFLQGCNLPRVANQ